MTCFIIIITYNAMPWIQKCLDSTKGYQVIIVDNNSTDGTVAYIKENYQEVHLSRQNKNLGFGQANNIGIRYAIEQEAEYVFLLNQDAYLKNGCIEKLLETQQKNQDYDVLSPIHLNGQGTHLDKGFLIYLNRYKLSSTLLFDLLSKNLSSVYSIEFVNAAGWLITRNCLQKVGGFDPLFFHYGEDRNYCQRVRYHKLNIGIVPDATIYHDRENRGEYNIEKYSEAYYKEFERYLKVDWADINVTNFEEKYSARARYLLSKQRRFVLKLQFQKAEDCQIKRKLMFQLRADIAKSRQSNTEGQMPYI
ncbi:glycosyltransferase family 2 protein [Aequorivita lipolytica]|uniref:Glycosyltransferase family 2 protein n=1 Tax=Aequorivita lipolytica TaxID=153267 RepID=A0A5C6YNB0_9FLAO|nr:glycosyltransferase family 2 protein [Aequorivita lipolytica]TXD68791.1 glycosyltransferase family 2 protein [Aequorivita lipolytica]SRX52040.1 hypothetical protein AEQU2_02021 [Aequorivita lipolytica]